MSTDWTTNKNQQFGNEELYLKMSDTFASIGLVDLDENETVDKVRNVFYNLYKRHNLCSGNGSWNLYDRYTSSNEYTNNKFDDLVVLSAAISVNAKFDDILYSKENDTSSINNRRTLIENELSSYITKGFCNDITLSGFFPHLDVVSEVHIGWVNGKVPCWEIGNETFYGRILYTDSCHTDDDPFKCIEPVPSLSETKYERNTMNDPDEPTAKYSWYVLKNPGEDDHQMIIQDGLDKNVLILSMKASGNLTDGRIRLTYTE